LRFSHPVGTLKKRRIVVRAPVGASSFHERLKAARIAAKFKTTGAAARSFGWNENTFKSHENGIRSSGRPPSEEVVRKYATAFGVDFLWLYAGAGPDLDIGGLDVVPAPITDEQGDAWSFPSTFIANELRAEQKNLVVVRCVGDAMDPTVRAGDRVLVDQSETEPSDGLFALRDKAGRTIVRRLQSDMSSRKITVLSDNPLHRPEEVQAKSLKLLGRVKMILKVI